METQDREKTPTRRSGLIVLAYLILAGLLAALPTRPLLQAQFSLLTDANPIAASQFRDPLMEMGIKEGMPPKEPVRTQSRIAATLARFPNDYAVQLGGALPPGFQPKNTNPPTAQEIYAEFQCGYGGRLAALQARFPERPGPCAHILREMTVATVRIFREGEVKKFETGKTSNITGYYRDRQAGCEASWAAFDQAAAQGEELDPDNAYFPMMRAIGLFDAKRDAEGIVAILRAGQKRRFEDYSLEAVEAAWTLSRRTYGPNAMLRKCIYDTFLAHDLMALRAMARLTAYKAMQAEQEGRVQDSLALRHAMMQCGERMREQGRLREAMTGGYIVARQANRPRGVPADASLTNLDDDQRADQHRDLYLAYLHKIGAEDEARWFTQIDATDRQTYALIEKGFHDHLMDEAVRPLPDLWMLDMLLLTNMLGMLLLCSAAAVYGRRVGSERKLPIVVVTLTALCLLAALPMRWAEGLTQMHLLLNTLARFYNENGLESNSYVFSNLTDRVPWVIHIGEIFFSLLAPMLTLIGIKADSILGRETFAVALTRGMRGGAVVFTTLLTVAYLCALIVTARAEARANALLDGMAHNGVDYLQQRARSGFKP